VETQQVGEDLQELIAPIPDYDRQSLLVALKNSIKVYQMLRHQLSGSDVILRLNTEQNVVQYFEQIEERTC